MNLGILSYFALFKVKILLYKLKSYRTSPGDSVDLAFRKLLILIISFICCICGLLWSAFYFAVFGVGIISALPLLFVAIVGAAILISHFVNNYKILVYTQIICIMWVTALIQWTIGGFDESGFVTAWSFLGPVGAVIFLSRHKAIFWMLMFLFIIVISAVFEPQLLGYKAKVSSEVRTVFYIMNICAAASVVFIAAAWFVSSLQHEKNRSDNLLLNILPVEVAEELKAKGSAEAKQFDEVTVLFTDFKNFTGISETMTAKELVEEIHTCFKAFDEIIEKYNIEKIKTIGDSYMCVGGLPVINQAHAVDVVMSGLEIRDFVEIHIQDRIAAGKSPFQIRIGIHTGPVIAGIVGIKKYAYDIWGDTVNTASRMESSSEAGKVNISGTTYELVKDTFNCIHRGKIQAKNKGELDMYFVEGRN